MTRIPLANKYGLPGIEAATESAEIQPWYGERYEQRFEQGVIKSTVVDAGNTPTTVLRPGLLLARRADKLYYAYDPDGSGDPLDAQAVAVLPHSIDMLNSAGTAVDKTAWLLIGGSLIAGNLLLLDAQARGQLMAGGKFRFDDDLYSSYAFMGAPRGCYQLITNATLTAAQSGWLFVCTTADCNITLPTIAAGLRYRVLMAANQELVITGSSNIIAGNTVAASTITATTTAEQIGICWQIEAVYVGTTLKWLVTREHTAGDEAFTVAVA